MVFSSCTSKPTEAVARAVFENGVTPIYKVVSFRKVNAIDGGGSYSIEYKAAIEGHKNFDKHAKDILKDKTKMAICLLFQENHIERDLDMSEEMKESSNTINLKLHGELIFVKTENGWKGEDGSIY